MVIRCHYGSLMLLGMYYRESVRGLQIVYYVQVFLLPTGRVCKICMLNSLKARLFTRIGPRVVIDLKQSKSGVQSQSMFTSKLKGIPGAAHAGA